MSRLWLAVTVSLVAASCTPSVPEAEPMLGIWRSDGYGTVLHVHDANADIYEISAVHCELVSAGTARRIDSVIFPEGDRLLLDDGGRTIWFDRIDELPSSCEADPVDDVVGVAVATIREHFHGSLDDGFEDRVGALDPTDVTAAILSLIAPLGDPQLVLRDPSGVTHRAVTNQAVEELAGEQRSEGFLSGVRTEADGGVILADLGDGIQYFGLLRLANFANGSERSQLVLANALDRALDGAKAIVIDLRTTNVGAETEALLVATRFVSAPAVVASKEARRSDGSWAPAGSAIVNPQIGGPFAGTVVVLVGPGTAGAAELLVLALRRLPQVTVVGEPTAGSPGAPLARVLPDGSIIGVPNINYVDGEGERVAGRPIAADVAAPITIDDIRRGRDPGLEAALQLLSE